MAVRLRAFDVRKWRAIRDPLLFTIGAVGFLHEVFFGAPTERPQIIYGCIALMCSPLVLRGEEKIRQNGNGKS